MTDIKYNPSDKDLEISVRIFTDDLENVLRKYTTTKVAEDELLEGKIDETYATSPHLDLEKYQLEEDEEGNHVLPENATGTYKSGIQEVTKK